MALKGWTAEEIAAVKGITVSAVRRSYKLAKSNLQKDLKRKGYIPGFRYRFLIWLLA